MDRAQFVLSLVASPLALNVVQPKPVSHAAKASDALAAVLGGRTWLGGRPTPRSLASRVVLVDVFTFECVNCTRVAPNLRRLRARYGAGDLAVLGVHTPEVPSYQSRLGYVADQARAQGLTWPIVLDNDAAIWRAYDVDAWPTQLLFDRRGTLRHRVVGDSQDAALDAAVAALVSEKG